MKKKQITKRTTEEIILLMMIGVCMAGLLPFSLIRYSRGDLSVALVDGVGFAACAGLFAYVVFTRRTRFASIFLATLSVGGMLINISMLGPRDLYFMYPVVIVVFFLVSPELALGIAGSGIAILAYLLFPDMESFEWGKCILSLIGCLAFAYLFASQRQHQHQKILEQSRIDPLTGIGNRRAMHERMTQLVSAYERVRQPMSLILIDLDHFKQVNDKYGHLRGDEVLRQVVGTVAQRIRATDTMYRYGGDEFVVLAINADRETGTGLADELRQLAGSETDAGRLGVTLSLGVAEYRQGLTEDGWLHLADEALYHAKESGKDQVKAAARSVGSDHEAIAGLKNEG